MHAGKSAVKIRKDGTKYMKTVKLCPRCGCIDPALELKYDEESEEKYSINGAPLHIITKIMKQLKEEYGYGISDKVEESQGEEVTESCEGPVKADFSETPRNGYKISDHGDDRGGYSPQS